MYISNYWEWNYSVKCIIIHFDHCFYILETLKHLYIVDTEPCSQLHGRYTQRRRQYVTPILRPQKSSKSKPVPHRWLGIPVALPGHGYGFTSLYIHSDNEAIYWCTYYVCTYKRNTKRCSQHILLDPSNLHIVISALETCWSGCSPSGSGQNARWSWQKTCQILPVGWILPVFSGKIYLYSYSY